MPEKEHVIDIEIHAEQNHENGDDPVDVGAAEVADACRVVGKAAGARRAEGKNEAVKKRHAAQHEQND